MKEIRERNSSVNVAYKKKGRTLNDIAGGADDDGKVTPAEHIRRVSHQKGPIHKILNIFVC